MNSDFLLFFLIVAETFDSISGSCVRTGTGLLCRNWIGEDFRSALSSDVRLVSLQDYNDSLPLLDLGFVCLLPNVSSVNIVRSGVKKVQASFGDHRRFVSSTENPLFNETCTNSTTFTYLNLSFNLIDSVVSLNQAPWFTQLQDVSLAHNRLTTFPVIACSVITLDLSDNRIDAVPDSGLHCTHSLRSLEVGGNRLTALSKNAFCSDIRCPLRSLLLQHNLLTDIDDEAFHGLRDLELLDLSYNLVQILPSKLLHLLPALKRLDVSHNPLTVLPPVRHENLQQLIASHLHLSYLSFTLFTDAIKLTTLDLSHNHKLRWVFGSLSNDAKRLIRLDLSFCRLSTLPIEFFTNCSLTSVSIAANPWKCDCNLLWFALLPTAVSLVDLNLTRCHTEDSYESDIPTLSTDLVPDLSNCTIGVDRTSQMFHRAVYGSTLYVGCDGFGYPVPDVLWQKLDNGSTPTKLFEWHPDGDVLVKYSDQRDISCLSGGVIVFSHLKHHNVGIYQCIVSNTHGNGSRSYFVRLDYAVWRQIKIYAVFVGIFTSLCFFILNITLLLIRRLVGWHLAKVERTGRVQNILEAMERCRQRQMDSLYEKYTTGIQQICENYRQQLEQLRKGYTQQSERFRDYRTAQIDAVTQHIDFIREGYAQQAGRVWEYGSKQMERLWDSYRRQVNRLRTFTISYRFRVMRQHKIKQKYWNKILASFNWDLYKLPSPKVIFIDPKTSQLPRISPEELANTKPVIKVPKISIISADAGDDDFDEHIDVDGATYSAIAEDPFSSRFNIRSSDGYRQPLQRDRNVEEHNGEGTMLLKHCSSHTSLITIDSDKKRLNDYECDENQKAFNESTFRSPDDGVELKSNEGHVAF